MTISDREKPYSITFELRPEFLYAYVKGSADSYEVSNGYWTEISRECSKLNVNKLLVDEDLEQPMASMSEVFHSASERPSMGLISVKIAFVDRHLNHHEVNQFGELVTTNRGLHCKVFYDLAEGESWLVSD
jgi:hypothetical protein